MHPPSPSDPPRQYVQGPLGTLSYTDEGDGHEGVGEVPLIAIHGLPGSIRDWRWLAPVVTAHRRLIRIELPGFGESVRPFHRPLTVEERAASVLALMDALDIPQADLVGHSAGGVVIAHLSRHHPERVRRCALLASAGPTPHYRVALYRWLMLPGRTAPGRALLAPIGRRLYRAMGFPSYLTDDDRLFSTMDAGAHDFAVHGDNLRHMTHPTLVAWADDDPIVPVSIGQAVAATVPDGPRLPFPEAGHALQKTMALEIGRELVGFLGRN